ncbi:MAG: hypothetical protein J6M91_05655 [Methanobrevibacter sp.]|nr:hypothetical protein [Methanobrevibacter sp.]
MDKSEKFLIKISSRNRKWNLLREKEGLLAKLVNVPYCVDDCLKLREEINFIRKELNLEQI